MTAGRKDSTGWTFWRRIPEGYQIAAVVAALVMTGWSARGVWADQASLPARVEQNTERIQANTVRIETLEDGGRMRDQALQAVEGKVDQLLCLQLSEKEPEKNPWQECLRD